MFGVDIKRLTHFDDVVYDIEDYQSNTPRWCPGCGDNGILTAVQRLCRDEQLPPEKTVFVSGIGCSSRFPHYMKTYGFHGLHGRALPIAQGIKIRRPDLHVFVNTGDGDCFSIGAAHWVHALRYNMNMMVMVHDNNVYGLTKMQRSPTSPAGLKTNTSPFGADLKPMNPLTVTLGVTNVSFVAQVVEWIPDLLYQTLKMAYHHRGFGFVRILQRCPAYLPSLFNPLINDPDRLLIMTHENGIQLSDSLAKIYKNQVSHNPSDIHKAREWASNEELVPVGILYRDETVPCYEDIKRPKRVFTPEMIQAGLEQEFDKFSVESMS